MRADEPTLFFGAMSPYSWLTCERIGELLPQARWQPIFVGGLLRAVGRESWGMGERREREMAECERRARAYGVGEMRWPERWPTNDVLVARGMVFAAWQGLLERFALAAMRVAFLEAGDLGERETVLEAGRRAGLAAGELEAALAGEDVKRALREATDGARAQGVMGVPTVAVGVELFWGDDRLEQAAAAAREHAGGAAQCG
jgi:2-hydroxychromene-2-carboxylate isomerase